LSDFDNEIKKSKIIHGTPSAGDIAHSFSSIEKAKTFLGYQPLYSITDGLKETVKWYITRLN